MLVCLIVFLVLIAVFFSVLNVYYNEMDRKKGKNVNFNDEFGNADVLKVAKRFKNDLFNKKKNGK